MLNVLSFSEVGGHQVNEDASAVQPHPLDANCWVCFVADGQGGRAGGGAASQVACHTALAAAGDCRPEILLEPSTWMNILRQADEAVAADKVAGFTTLIGLCVIQNRVVGASSGDSAAMLFCGDDLTHLTAHQQKNPPVGSGAAIAIPFAAKTISPWLVLAMSDGVWKYVGWDQILDIVRIERGQALIDNLQQAARLPRSGEFQDDFTVVLLEDRT